MYFQISSAWIKQNRFSQIVLKGTFASAWYQNRPWLEYSLKGAAVYCFPCRRFKAHALSHFMFTAKGFRDCKHDLQKVKAVDPNLGVRPIGGGAQSFCRGGRVKLGKKL